MLGVAAKISFDMNGCLSFTLKNTKPRLFNTCLATIYTGIMNGNYFTALYALEMSKLKICELEMLMEVVSLRQNCILMVIAPVLIRSGRSFLIPFDKCCEIQGR